MRPNNHRPSSFHVAVAGQPNTGKSTIFNALTGLHQEVGNWAGKTVEKKMGKAVINGETFQFVDLPGTYSLLARSEEEKIAVQHIMEEQIDAIVIVVNAANLARTLNYCLDILLIGVPCILAVNMADVAQYNGININIESLENALDIPCIELVASKKRGVENLRNVLSLPIRISNRKLLPELIEKIPLELKEKYKEILKIVSTTSEKNIDMERLVWKAMEGDTFADKKIKQLIHKTGNIFPEIAATQAQTARFTWIQEILEECIIAEEPQETLTQRCDKFFLHPFWGYVFMAVILLSAISVGLLVGYPTGIGISILIQDISTFVVNSLPSSMPMLTALIQSIFLSASALVCMVPLIAVFYFIFSFLEEIGYIPRTAFLMDSLMTKLGLNGMSFIPLLFSLPCNIPGIIGTRTIAHTQQRLHTLLLIPLVPCSSKIIVLLTLCTWLFSPIGAIIAACGIMGFSFLLFMIASIWLKKTLMKGENSYDMLMELPLFHAPNFQIIGLHVLHNVLAFLKKASAIILGFGVILWFLSYYPAGNINSSYLGMIGTRLEPLASFMGLDWKLLTSLMTSALSRETVLPTMALLYNVPIESLKVTLQTQITTASAISFLLAQFLSMPCLPTLGMIFKESNSLKKTFFVACYTILLPIVVSIGTYTMLTIVL
ncbi:ferrous iron transport protein B [Desulfovibrio inopinatus]|uniref:ferrous iron transport protein B n=1 Tax=Desulfovibrio inopinatus TaxID=102109 RepID=UPI0003FE3BC4|nr:ferrous iron transport protein B [Desulfovibrio inopinatus]